MLRRLLLAALCSLAGLMLVPAALAGGPSLGVVQGGEGLLSEAAGVRYVAMPGVQTTSLAKIRISDGKVLRFVELPGMYGVPLVAAGRPAEGLAADGKTLVLGDTAYGRPLKLRSEFAVIDTKRMKLQSKIQLKGDFAFDALSPDGSMLYLIQHVSERELLHYVVRAFDFDANRLLPGRIADKTQKSWIMNGYPVARATSEDGRWAYTFYQNPGGYPFVHALDTVRGTAHCIGIPFEGKQDSLYNMRLALLDGGKSLALRWQDGRSYMSMNTTTWRLSQPESGVAAATLGAGIGGGAVLLLALFVVLRGPLRRRRT
jgi:hypothetical protein